MTDQVSHLLCLLRRKGFDSLGALQQGGIRWLRVMQASELLGVSRQAVYQAVKEGRIESIQQHGVLLVDPATFNGGKHERNKA